MNKIGSDIKIPNRFVAAERNGRVENAFFFCNFRIDQTNR